MFDYLVKDNGLEPVMKQYGLQLPCDLDFVKELIDPPDQTPDEWKYKGRGVEKSFLYEIVNNKITGIDVDKFDYFARDCYHLGVNSNFDYRRFIMFARVCEVEGRKCEVEGRKHICCRNKVVQNLYDMFHTRNYIHRIACEHRVNTIIQHMIKDAFLKADGHLKIKGSGGTEFTLSTARHNLEAYTKLTDQVFEEIFNSPKDELKEAKKILERIISRRIPKCLGEIKPKKGGLDKNMFPKWKEELAKDSEFHTDDFDILLIEMDYGMKDKNPIDNMYFYNKDDPTRAFKIDKEKVFQSKFLPKSFSEKFARVYYKKTDQRSQEAAQKHFVTWCKKNKVTILQDREVVSEDKRSRRSTL